MTRKDKKKRIMKDINYIISHSQSDRNVLYNITKILGENILGEVSEEHPIYSWGTIVERIIDNDKFDEALWKLEEEILKNV